MPTETSKPRLIDANAFSNALNRRYGEAIEKKSFEEAKGIEIAIRMLFIAPTVETTDDVLARLPEITSVGKTLSGKFAAIMFDEEGTILDDMGFVAKTPLEALKKLEASINRK